jgi:hypothetical protein
MSTGTDRRPMTRLLAVAAALVAMLVVTSLASAASPKLGKADIARLGTSNLRGSLTLDLVHQRGCDARRCFVKAMTDEIAGQRRAAGVAKSLLPKLSAGPCRQVIMAQVASMNRRVALVIKALAAYRAVELPAFRAAYSSDAWRTPLTVQIDRCT